MILITDPSPATDTATDILFRSTTDRLASHCRSPVVSGSYLNWKRLYLARCWRRGLLDIDHLGGFQDDVSACSVWRHRERVHRWAFRWLRDGYRCDADSDNVIQAIQSQS